MDPKRQIFFQNSKKNCGDLLARIGAAVDGLTYMSETDAPVLMYAGPAAENVAYETILQQAVEERDARVEEVSVDQFFQRSTEIKDWFGEAEKARAKKFLTLKKLLEESLRDLKVFKVGSVRIDIFVVGIDPDGRLMGIRTMAVET